MSNKKEGSLQFVKNYLKLFRNGKTTDEIAQIYNISHSYAYVLVTEVAKREHVDRASLLRFPHAKPRPYIHSIKEKRDSIDDQIFDITFDSIVNALENAEDLTRLIGEILKM